MDTDPAPAPTASTTVDTIDVGERGTLLVRPVGIDDVDGLEALYAGLSLQDRYRRFFSAYRPSRDVIERWATIAERGGYGLVAEVHADGAAPRIVADANFARLEDGVDRECGADGEDGELAITVAADWRGWLAPYLLDRLVEAARERGIGNLEAEVLTENQPMLALLRARGYAVVSHPDWTVVRVAISTSGRVPTWPARAPAEGGRVLVEAPGGRWRCEELARQSGLEVVTCAGPPAARPDRCPLLAGGRCPLAEGADAIVVALRPSDPTTQALLAHHRSQGAVPVVVPAELDHPTPQDEVAAVTDTLS